MNAILTMKCKFALVLPLGAILLSGTGNPARANIITESASYADGIPIPDNDLVGVADTRSFGSSIQTITEVQLTLDITGGFNGDFYAYLAHGNSGFAVLLNRVGLGVANPYGYADSGLDVTFADHAANGDIHAYHNVLNPNGGALTGTWQPDGRNVDPSLVEVGNPRTAMLSSFKYANPNGDWTLYVADTSPLGVGTLVGWNLQVTGSTSVPDGGSTGLLFAGAAVLVAGLRKRFAA